MVDVGGKRKEVELTEYEKQRLANIARNKKRKEALNIRAAVQEFNSSQRPQKKKKV